MGALTPIEKYCVVALETSAEMLPSMWSSLLGMTPMAARRKLQEGYLGNPVGAGHCSAIIATSSGQVVGSQCLHLRRFHRGADSLVAACLSDFVVSPEHRSAGPAVMLMRATVDTAAGCAGMVYGFPSEKAKAICTRAGLRQVGVLARMGKLLRLREAFRGRSMPWWARLAQPLADGALSWLDVLLLWSLGTAGTRCDESAPDDPGIDEVWRERDPDLLLSERTGAMLAWRYGYDEQATPWRTLLVRKRGGAAIGYVVCRLEDDLAIVSDFFCRRPAHESASLLLSAARHLRRQGVGAMSMELMAGPPVHRQLRRAAFLRWAPGQPVYRRRSDAPNVPAECHFLTGFDRDI